MISTSGVKPQARSTAMDAALSASVVATIALKRSAWARATTARTASRA
jgi:hypothetical protein